MNKSSAGLFSIWPRDEMKSGSVGKVLPPKRMTLMGKVLKKWYTVKELVPLYTKKKHQKHEKEHPENIRKSPVFHFAMSRMSLLQPCLQQFQNRLPRSTELVGGFPGIGVKQKLGFAIIIFSGSFHKHFTNPKKLLENLDLNSILGNVFLPVGSSGFVSPNLATHESPSYLWLSLWPVHSASLAVRRRRGGLGEGWEGLDLAMTHWGKSFFNESTWLFSKQKWK